MGLFEHGNEPLIGWATASFSTRTMFHGRNYRS